ncbi:zona pellucida protein AX 4 [Cebidichthys violaceus]|uniref:zona pellucida protein AX 4 n=1 Tax=Cebidichthys violaceus TaxID=271503 RepID=UPI0035C99E40
MTFGFCFGVSLLLSLWSTAECSGIPEGALHMECRDRYFMIAVDLSFTGDEPLFEAVDGTGVYAITRQYSAQCGYCVRLLPLLGRVELRASYFSCHAENENDEVFSFNFTLTVTREGRENTYVLNKTCSPSLPWSPREITCEENYMEVSVRSEVACPPRTVTDDWNALKPAHSSTTSDWQVMFQRNELQLPAMNLSEARKQGYAFALTDGRLVFRTPYGQPESFSTEVNGVPVEAVHATLFSRQSWVVLMVDLVTACSVYEGSYDDSSYMVWQTPEVPYRRLYGTQLNVGLNGELVAQPVAEERLFVVDNINATVQISVPLTAEGGYRKSFVLGDLVEIYVFHLYLEQILADEDRVETRVRFQRTLSTPLLPHPVFTENQTVVDELAFTVYLGDVPADVALVAIYLNGEEFTVQFMNASSHNITKVVYPNNTLGYTLTVPFDDSVVLLQFSDDAVLQYELNINYTLTVLPENEPFYHLTSVMAFVDASPPAFDAVCSKSGISFRRDHRPYDSLWGISIGSDLLTPELAVKHGYIMSNDSQSLRLTVPLFSHGYKYHGVTLNGFYGTFKILMRDHETSEVESSTIKSCPFTANELILCSTQGRLTVVADMALASPIGGLPAKFNLVDKFCGPRENNGTRALFSFPLNTCGTTIKLSMGNVTYLNEIFYSGRSRVPSDAVERVIIQCTYPLASLHRLFTTFRFESDTAGIGSIIHTKRPISDMPRLTIKPTTALQTTPASPVVSFMRADSPSTRYIRVPSFHNLARVLRRKEHKDPRKVNPALI